MRGPGVMRMVVGSRRRSRRSWYDERAPRLRSDDAVGREVMTVLEPDHRSLRPRAEDAVGATDPHRVLQRDDRGAARTGMQDGVAVEPVVRARDVTPPGRVPERRLLRRASPAEREVHVV